MKKVSGLIRSFWVFSVLSIGAWSPSGFASSDPEELPDGWREIKPGGETICARGDDFSFFVSPGTSNKIVIDFIGGGACWNAQTCDRGTATFTDSVDSLRERQRRGLEGIYDRSRQDNPLKDWTHVVIPYCTGDIHWGSNEVTYTRPNGSTFNIHHKGAVNARAVLDWVGENVTQPEKVFVTGCSAGSYGSVYWAPHIREMYPESPMIQMGDAGAGVVTRRFFEESFPLWNATQAAPRWIPELNPDVVDWSQLDIIELYKHVGAYYPSMVLGQFTNAFDTNQTFYYEIMGGLPENWSPVMYQNLSNIHESTSNFRSYVAPGSDHCVIPYERFYSVNSSGVSFSSWFEGFISDAASLESVNCTDCDPDGVGG